MAKKRQKRSATKKAVSRSPQVARKPAGKPSAKTTAKASSKGKATAPAKRAVAPPRRSPAPAGPALVDLAQRLRDEVQQSKLTHPDPWIYGVKARAWGERAQVLVELIAGQGDTPATRRRLEALDGEVRGDRDFREARRLF